MGDQYENCWSWLRLGPLTQPILRPGLTEIFVEWQGRAGKVEALETLNQVARFVVNVDAAAATRARKRLCNEKESVLRIVRNDGAAIGLAAGPGIGKLHRESRLLREVVKLDLGVEFGRRTGDAGPRIDGETVHRPGAVRSVVEAGENGGFSWS